MWVNGGVDDSSVCVSARGRADLLSGNPLHSIGDRLTARRLAVNQLIEVRVLVSEL